MNLKPTRHTKMRRPPLPPILEIDEDGVPVSDLGFVEGRRFSGDDEEPGGFALSDWPTELDD